MRSHSLTKQARWDDACVVADKQFVAAEEIRKVYKGSILGQATPSVQNEHSRGIPTFQGALCDQFLRQVVVEFVDPHGLVAQSVAAMSNPMKDRHLASLARQKRRNRSLKVNRLAIIGDFPSN